MVSSDWLGRSVYDWKSDKPKPVSSYSNIAISMDGWTWLHRMMFQYMCTRSHTTETLIHRQEKHKSIRHPRTTNDLLSVN